MEDEVFAAKVLLTGLFAAGSALWGKFGWLIIIWVVCMALDYASGTLSAMKAGEWNSERAREGAWHKAGMILAVAVSGLADLVIGLILRMDALALPFDYTVLLSVIVIIWYILTELGSIAENAVQLGAKVPGFLQRILKVSANAVEQTGDNLTGGTDNE